MNNTRIFKILWALSPAKFFLTLSVITLFTFSSCNKTSILGLEVQPPNDLIDAEFQDTLTLNTQTIIEDTLRTSAISTVLMGKYYDDVFGEATASVYTQMRMYSNAPSFGVNPKCDSVRLSLIYAGSYGKKDRKKQLLSVYELTSAMDINATYYSDNKTILDNGIDLANYEFVPKPTDSVYTDTTKTKRAPQLRVPLRTDFGQRILDKQNSTELATNDNFIQFIKGLKITTENTSGLGPKEGNLLQFNMSSSTLYIYFTYDDTVSKKKVHTVFGLSLSSVARFMKFNHNYNKAIPDLQNQVIQKPAPLSNDVCYAQGAAGVKTRIKIPNLVTWGKKDFIGINRAELVVTAISSVKDTFALPSALSLFGIADDGTTSYFLPDAYDGTEYFGGTLKTDTTINQSTYKFTITRYIQRIISGNLQNNGLYLSVSGGSSLPHRIVFGGGKAELTGGGENKYKMKLNITYTKLK